MSNVARRFLSFTAGALILLAAASANANMVLEMDVVFCGTPGAGNPDKGMHKARYTIKDAALITIATQSNVTMFVDQSRCTAHFNIPFTEAMFDMFLEEQLTVTFATCGVGASTCTFTSTATNVGVDRPINTLL